MAHAASRAGADAVRRSTRFYPREIGVLDEHLLHSAFSLTEMRVLYELAHRAAPTAADLGRDLGLDAGYLSRILRRFHARGLIRRTASPADARESLLQLTRKGAAAFAPLETRARAEVARLLLAEPAGRGLGIGRRLVEECVRFARDAGYRTLTLWTQSELDAARRLYTEAGFRRVHEEAHRSFGKDLVAETWELRLAAPRA